MRDCCPEIFSRLPVRSPSERLDLLRPDSPVDDGRVRPQVVFARLAYLISLDAVGVVFVEDTAQYRQAGRQFDGQTVEQTGWGQMCQCECYCRISDTAGLISSQYGICWLTWTRSGPSSQANLRLTSTITLSLSNILLGGIASILTDP